MLTLHQVEKLLPGKFSVVQALVKSGHLKTVQVTNPVNRATQTAVSPKEVERFRNQYISLGELARSRGTAAWALKAKIETGLIEPAFNGDRIGVQYFRRADMISN
jgi:hypothetical protein